MSTLHDNRHARRIYLAAEMTDLAPVRDEDHSRWISIHDHDGSFVVILTAYDEVDETSGVPNAVRFLADFPTLAEARAFVETYGK